MSTRASLVVLLVLSCSLAACAPRTGDPAGNETGQITGTVTYRERIALMPGATVRVALEDVSRADVPSAVIADTLIRPERQVPIPFTLTYDRGSIDSSHVYTVRAEIRSGDGALRWISTEHYGVLTQGNPSDVELIVRQAGTTGEETIPGMVDSTRVWHYACTGLRFNIRFAENRATIFLPDGQQDLPLARSASGARYAGADVEFWGKGDSARVVVNGTEYTDCAVRENVNPWEEARQRGASFRAVGNEPGWHLDVHEGDSLVVVTAYGDQRTVTPYPDPMREGNRTTYAATTEAHRLRAVIEETPCQDTMSGEAFEYTVTVTLDGETFHGCGRSL